MNVQLGSQKKLKTLGSLRPLACPLPSPGSPLLELSHSGTGRFPSPHTQQKACRKIPKCRRDGHAWKHLSYADIRMASQSRAAGGSAANIVTRSAFSQHLWLRLHRLQVLQLLHTHFSIPCMARPVWGWEEGTPRAQRMVGNAVDRAASLQADSTHSSLSLAALKAVRGLAGRGSVWRSWPQPRHVEILAPSQQ